MIVENLRYIVLAFASSLYNTNEKYRLCKRKNTMSEFAPLNANKYAYPYLKHHLARDTDRIAILVHR
jgi:hypothetical protein